MKCAEVEGRLHDLIDQVLPARESLELQGHLADCPSCRERWEDLQALRRALASRLSLPEALRSPLWKEIRSRTGARPFRSRVREAWHNLRGYVRDLDRNIFWSRLAALPVSLVLFLLIFSQFAWLPLGQWSYPVVMVSNQAAEGGGEPTPRLRQGQMRQPVREVRGLVDTVWNMSDEDSLSVVVGISREGTAEIGDVLLYPKNQDLLRAVDMVLKNSQFEDSQASSFIFYSVQKIDVYGGEWGL